MSLIIWQPMSAMELEEAGVHPYHYINGIASELDLQLQDAVAQGPGGHELAQKLLNEGADPNAVNKNGLSAMDIAINTLNRTNIHLLLFYGGLLPTHMFDQLEIPLLVRAVIKDDRGELSTLLDLDPDMSDIQTAFLCAVGYGRTNMIALLRTFLKTSKDLSAAADVLKGIIKRKLTHQERDHYLEIQGLLGITSRPAPSSSTDNPPSLDECGKAVIVAFGYGNLEVARLLVANGASNIDEEVIRNILPTDLQRSAALGFYQEVKVILESGIPDQSDIQKAFEYAIAQGRLNVVRLLIDAGAQVNNELFLTLESIMAKCPHQSIENYRMIKKILEKFRTKSAKMSPLFEAIKTDDIERVKALLEAGADVAERDVNELTPLDYAFKIQNRGIIARWLIKYGAKGDERQLSKVVTENELRILDGSINNFALFYMDQYDKDEALCFAIGSQQKDIIEKLLKYGANAAVGLPLVNGILRRNLPGQGRYEEIRRVLVDASARTMPLSEQSLAAFIFSTALLNVRQYS